MAKVYAHMGIGSVRQLFDFAGQRIGELREGIMEANKEIEMWETLKKKLNACIICHGKGEIGYSHPTEAQKICYKTCNACGGSGENK